MKGIYIAGMTYTPETVEPKWQQRWAERRTNEPDLDRADRPFYNLMMFPYPSAEGLHVGNFYAFTGSDVFGRFQRLRGYTVFEPIGFDAFGIHSENFALKMGVHPLRLIPRNIENFTRQLVALGGMFDWSHVLATTDPRYYRWTQWVFLQLFNAGKAYKKKAPVNWCPSCKTVLANEQVIAGACERCGTAVEQRLLEQWFFRITEYVERLLENLDDPAKMDWSASTAAAQRNWIGRSTGAEIDFKVAGGETIRVFTTRPDTIFGATFMVLAPEHPLVDAATVPERRAAVEAYRRTVAAKDLVSRKVGDKAKTGVFTGGFAINPATGKPIPIWIADYVLMDYGTGAIMAVPGHDDRDFAFATAHGLEIVRVIARAADDDAAPLSEPMLDEEGCRLVNSGAFSGKPVAEGAAAITRMLEAAGSGKGVVRYRLHDWCISGSGTGDRRFRSSTATTADRSACRKRTCRSSYPIFPISSRTTPGCRRWPGTRNGITSPAPAAVSRAAERRMSRTPFSIRRGTTCDICRPRSRIARSSRPGCGSGSRRRCTSAATSTRCSTCCTPDS
jgi:leucyl-tRNA synthetase